MGVTVATVGAAAHSLVGRRREVALLIGQPQLQPWMEMVKAQRATMIAIAAAAAETTIGAGTQMFQTVTALMEAAVMVPGPRSSQMPPEGGSGTCHRSLSC